MKNHYFIFLAAFILFNALNVKINAQAPDFAWAKRAGGTEADAASRITADASGNSYVTGIFRGSASFDTITLTSSGSTDIFIAKYDASGKVLWAKQAGGPDIDAGKNIAVDISGNSYVTGEFRGTSTFGSTILTSSGNYDTFIAKYDSSGNLVWVRQSGGTADEMGRGIIVGSSGDCYITGYFDGSASFGTTTLTSTGSFDIFVAKYDAAGKFQWANRAGSSAEDFGRNIAVDGSGNSYITGTFKGVANFGSATLTSNGAEDMFIAKYDALGNLLWAKSAGGTNKDAANGIDVDASGNSSIAGEFQGTATFGSNTITSTGSLPDIFIARYDPSGTALWAKRAGGSSNDFGRNIAVDSSGNSYMAGEFEGSASFGITTLTSAGGVDVFVAKYDASGNVIWAKRAGSNLEDRASGIGLDSIGNTYISGYFLGEASFGSHTITSSGGSDVYISKLSAAQPVNISTRMRVESGDNALIAGFIITGSSSKKMIIRGVGPSLGFNGTLVDPMLELHTPDGVVTNDDWRSNQEQEIIGSGVPPANNSEAAIIATLKPGAYTTVLRGTHNTTGVGLVELYDLDPAGGSVLANISTRGLVQTGDNVMIAGFILGGADAGTKVVVRALGPSLGAAGVANTLPNPRLSLHNGNGELLVNNDWGDDAPQAAELESIGIQPANDREAAVAVTLPAGAYTAVVKDEAGNIGIGLVEVYNIR